MTTEIKKHTFYAVVLTSKKEAFSLTFHLSIWIAAIFNKRVSTSKKIRNNKKNDRLDTLWRFEILAHHPFVYNSLPCVIPVIERLSLGLLWAMISYWADSHLKSCQTSTMELFKIASSLKTLTFVQKSSIADIRLGPKWSSDWNGAVNV